MILNGDGSCSVWRMEDTELNAPVPSCDLSTVDHAEGGPLTIRWCSGKGVAWADGVGGGGQGCRRSCQPWPP